MDRKELIMNAALKLFVSNGFHGTATAKIAQEAGVANGTLFQHFKTKDELIIALFVAFKEELSSYMLQNPLQSNNVKEQMSSQFMHIILWAIANPEKFHYIQQFHTSPYINQVGHKILKKYIEPHYILIQKGVKDGQIKPLETDLLYALISSQTFGLHHFLIAKKLSKKLINNKIQQTFDMLWDMISL
jgi:AcrR family transcriptional regulator